jgi:hypothetical protein
MPLTPRLNVRDFYDLAPRVALAAGDIWSGLPTFGLVPGGAGRAIVVTPACDLSNHKLETATYLTILTLRQYLRSPAFVPAIVRETSRHLETLGLPALSSDTSRFLPPTVATLETTCARLGPHLSISAGKKNKESAARAIAGIEALRACRAGQPVTTPTTDLEKVFGNKNWRSTLGQIVRNAFRLDLFFLPADEQRLPVSAVPDPSVVLFRYPFSAPIQLLELAQDVQVTDWPSAVRELRDLMPGVDAFSAKPLKHGTLRSGFLSNMLTRFASMHVRLGTPDLSEASVEAIVDCVAGGPE